jgi:hypothetical protein
MAMGRQRQQIGRNQNAVSFRNKERTLGPVSNTIILIVLACLLGLLYLTQVTKTNAYGYQINDLQEQQQKLATEREDLEVASARLQSLDRVENSDTAKKMTAVAPSGSVRN